MRRFLIFIYISTLLIIHSAMAAGRSPEQKPANTPLETIQTSIARDTCDPYIEDDDPNDTVHRICPGVGGYKLIVRRGSGRSSIDVLDPTGTTHTLKFGETITRSMSNISHDVTWHVMDENDSEVPVYLVVRVFSREGEDPAQITHTYDAVTRISPDEICVVDSVLVKDPNDAEVFSISDTESTKKCLEPLPPLK